MNGASPSPIRVKTVLVVLGLIVALAALLGTLIGAAGSDDGYATDGVEPGGTSDSQFYDSGSIVRDDDGTIIYFDDNGNGVSVDG